MKRTMLVTTALIVSTVAAPSPAVAESARSAPPARGLAAPVRAAAPLADVSPVKVAIGRFEPTPGAITYRTYVRGTDGRVWFRDLSTAGAPTSDWRPLSGVVASGPDVVPNAARTAHVLAARSTSGSLIVRDIQPNGVASAWRDLGGKLTSAPSIALYADDTTYAIVARGTDNGAWIRIRRGGIWQNWANLGGQLTSALDIYTMEESRFVVSGRGRDGHLWIHWVLADAPRPAPWTPSFYTATSAPTARGIIRSAVPPLFYYRGADNALYFGAHGGPWEPARLGGQLTSAPDQDNPGGLRSVQEPPEFTHLIVARDAANSLALFNAITKVWTNLGGALT